jgi:hypothetical protein
MPITSAQENTWGVELLTEYRDQIAPTLGKAAA